MRDAGFDIDFEVVEWGSLLVAILSLPDAPAGKGVDAINCRLSYIDPSSLYRYHHTASFSSANWNWGHFSNPKIDELLARAQESSDKTLEVGINRNRQGAAPFQLLQVLAGDEVFLEGAISPAARAGGCCGNSLAKWVFLRSPIAAGAPSRKRTTAALIIGPSSGRSARLSRLRRRDFRPSRGNLPLARACARPFKGRRGRTQWCSDCDNHFASPLGSSS
jgi:hypothetical protein